MGFSYSNNKSIVRNIILQMIKACDMIMEWNRHIKSVDDYLMTMAGMQKLAANCMLIESIGEGVKKIDKLLPGFLDENCPQIPWKSIKGMRDHIAHGYFNIDAEFVYDVVVNEIQMLGENLVNIVDILND